MKSFAVFIFTLATLNMSHAFDHSHLEWDKILKSNIKWQGKQSLVNYQAIKKNIAPLNAYLKTLSAVSKREYDTWSDNKKLAFLINSYNAFTVKMITNHYPVKSIKDIGNFFKNTWKIKFFNFLGNESHLDHIEHDIIRKDFNEPRIHFAVVCASISCPTLLDTAFTEKNLESLLAKGTEIFLTDKSKNAFLDTGKKNLKLSKIFDWYGDDFKKTHGSFYKFISSKITKIPQTQKLISSGLVKTSFFKYNWKLNEWTK